MKVTGTTFWDDPNFTDILSTPATDEEWKRYIEAWDIVVNWLRENGYKYSGFYYQDGDNTIPIIDNKWLFQVTYRTWGALMAEAWPEDGDEDDPKAYIRWAWINEEVILPN